MEPIRDILPTGSISRRGTETREDAFYTCPTCGPVEPYYVKLSGRYLRQPCACLVKERQRRADAEWKLARLREQARITFDWLGKGLDDLPLVQHTFDTFMPVWWATKPEPHEVDMRDALEAACMFCTDMEARTLVLASETFGTGKTHLLAAICNELRLVGKLSRFAPAPKFFRAIASRMNNNEDYTGLVHAAITTPLLILDDVDKAKPSEWKEEIYYQIIDERTKQGKPLALSTNKLTDLAHYIGGAACSRLSIGQIAVEMSGDDFRMEM